MLRLALSVPAAVLALALGAAYPAKSLETLNFQAPGASEELLDTLRASSFLEAARNEGRLAPIDLMTAARAEYGRLLGLVYEEGHYAAAIHVLIDGREAAEVSPLATPARIDRISVEIDLGPVFSFGEISISPLAPGTELPADFAEGQPARSTTVRAALRTALDAWRADGYALAAASGQQVVANHTTQRLNVRLSIAPGQQLRLGQVIAQGNERTRSDRIVAIAGLERGAVHDPEALRDAETRLRQTGTFASVVLRTAEHANPDGTIDVEARVAEAPPRRLGFGAEIDSESGGRLSGFWLHRNLLGGAERFRMEASIDGIGAQTGGLGYALDLRYTRPATLDRDTDLELGLNAVRLDEADYLADAFTTDAILRRRYSDALTATGGLSLRFETADFSGTSADFGTFGVPVSVTHDTRDEPLDATTGRYLWAEAMPYFGFSAADNGLRLRGDARAYSDMGTGGRFVLAGRAQMGAILGSDLNDTPRGFLFYSGGGGSVRGLPYQSLGVRTGGVDSGGLGFAGLSGELRMRLNETYSIVAFADAGMVSEGVFTGDSDWQAGGGFGLRYATAIGPLRLDLATPIRRNATATGNDLQIYIGIGQAF